MCSSCKYLKTNNLKNGVGGGCLYYCSKNKCYVNCLKCSNYELGNRSKNEIKEIKNNTEKYSEIPDGFGLPIFIIIVLVVIGLLVS